MATRTWVGRARATSQVTASTVTGYDAATVYKAGVNGKAVSVSGAGSAALTADALAAAWNLETAPEFAEVTASSGSGTLTLTGDTAGRPFTPTLTATGGTGTVGSLTTTAADGPNWWSTAANWAENAVPVSGDDVVLDGGPSVLYGLSQAAVALASLRVTPNFPASSEIGLPANTAPSNPAAGYPEYRPQRLAVGADVVEIETASRRVRLDLGAGAAVVTVNGTGRPAAAGEAALDLLADNASTVLRVNRGVVGVAVNAGDAATLAEIDVGSRDDPAGDADVRLGRGLTVTTVRQSGGSVALGCGAAAVTKTGGTLTRTGSGAVGTLDNQTGAVLDDGTGAITALTNAGTYRRRGLAPLTVAGCTLSAGSVTDDPNGTVTWTNPVELVGCHPAGPPADPGPRPCYFRFGSNRKITPQDV